MKVVTPKPFTFKGTNNRAVLLLHGFTGNTADVRMLARFLNDKGYTCHAPQYKGHGVPPEELVHTGPEDWWQDVKNGFEFLKGEGYEEIAVAGLSLGGVFSLKLGYTERIKGIVTMCTPMYLKSEQTMYEGVLEFAQNYKKFEGKSTEQIEEEMKDFKQKPMNTLKALQELIGDVRDHVDMIYTPTFVIQATQDEMINPESANIIYQEVEAEHKQMKWYEDSKHAITLDKERDQVHEDVYDFLQSLDWS
ncbi:carboxylesterase [Bacillus carboniphilus]|uniref:Carboxylesterase n=1 Tax=Bacillus carboniphilus TaxID=86663 RepID=A0ABY9JT15_9BACI|nr:carboxylesterase [Bacillus carboniphilus]WLR41418.1 carboxylesterase [Bacillus carboniphilus]